ncbi:MAG: SpoIID/LytB domain-containing protein [Candidatus Edwardsbacteria bacterium]
MKTPILWFFLLLFFSGCATLFFQPAVWKEPPLVRIAILKNINSVKVSSNTRFQITDGRRVVSLSTGDCWTFSCDSLGLTILNERSRRIKDPTLPVRIFATEKNGQIIIGNKKYREAIEIRQAKTIPKLLVINELNMEDYLRSVVPAEICPITEKEIEAAKAQAIAARTYALTRLGSHSDEGYDLESTVADQVYNGAGIENPLTDEAVKETRGIFAFFQGQPIVAYYHSTCGGKTANVEEIWERLPVPYLKSIDDEKFCLRSPQFQWHREWSREEIQKLIDKNLSGLFKFPSEIDMGLLLDIRILGRSITGRIKLLEIITTNGYFPLYGNKIREFLMKDRKSLPSLFFDLKVERENGVIERVIIEGRGWGHGVGLCQWGAIGRAEKGRNFRKILKDYYQEIELVKKY